MRNLMPVSVVSDFAAAEFASALARRFRMKEIVATNANQAFGTLDAWIARVCERVETTTADVRAAETFLRRLDLNLRTPDALNIAIALRAQAAMATFDDKMTSAARALGLAIAAV